MLHDILLPVRRRLWMAAMVRGATLGFLIGAGAALVVSAVRLGVPSIHWGWPFVMAISGVVLGWFVGAMSQIGESTAARLIDQHYHLKDRSISALQFAGESSRDSIRQLQIDETNAKLGQVDAADCVSLQAPKAPMKWAGAMMAGMLMLLVVGGWLAPEVEAKAALPLAKDQSAQLRETMLPELEQLAEEQQDPEIEQLVEELKEKLDQMEAEAIDEADLMAALSEMEQSLAEAREALQVELTDTMLQALASAMKPSDVLNPAAKAMEAEEYDEASEELAKVDPKALGDKQRRAVADNLKKMYAKLQPGQMGQLSQTISELAEGLDAKNMSQCKQCLSKLAKACDKQGQCKKIGKCMSRQLNRLAMCKSNCRSQCMSNSVAKSNSPSQSAGMGASGKPLGDQATQIDSVRQQEQLTGVQSEGPSETEILQAPEGEQDAVRQFAKKYSKFRREAEAVLNSEPLPMGHRETVRTYFEAIRPSNEAETE